MYFAARTVSGHRGRVREDKGGDRLLDSSTFSPLTLTYFGVITYTQPGTHIWLCALKFDSGSHSVCVCVCVCVWRGSVYVWMIRPMFSTSESLKLRMCSD